MLADIPRILADPLRYLEHAVATWGDLVAFPVGARTALLVNDPDGVDRVLRRNAAAYGKQTLQYETLSLLTGQGLLTAPTALWRERRRQVAPAFHRRTLDGLLATTDAAATTMIASLRPEGVAPDAAVQVEDAIQTATLDIVASALFGAELHADAGRLAHAVVSGLDGVIGRATSPLKLPLRVPTPANIRLRRSLRELDTVVDRLVRDRSGGAAADGFETRQPDLLDLLLDHVEDPAGIRDEIVTLVVAGHETVASALTWALWLLADHPDIADAVASEAADVLDDGAPDLARLGRLQLTRAVVDETLRLYPPSWVLSRRALETDVVAGVPVAAGTLIILSPWTLHRRADSWPDPSRFDPSRFDPSRFESGRFESGRFESGRFDPGRVTGTSDPSRQPAYIPFGAGQRMCIGRDFALLEATVLLARLAQAFEIRPVPGLEVRPYARVTVRPRRPLLLGLQARRVPVRPSVG
jgi:cytochrome P450